MSMIIRNIVGSLEKQLVDIYGTMKSSVMGLSKAEAQKIARQMLLQAKEKVKQYSFDKLPLNFGDHILQKEKADPKFMNMDVKRKDGVQDADVKWFWNMHSLEDVCLKLMTKPRDLRPTCIILNRVCLLKMLLK